MNQTAHISLQISNFQTALRQKKLRCALTSWRAPPLIPLNFYPPSEPNPASPPPSAPSGAPLVHLCAAGKGGSRVMGSDPQPLFSASRRIFGNFRNSNIFHMVISQFHLFNGQRYAKMPAENVIANSYPQGLAVFRPESGENLPDSVPFEESRALEPEACDKQDQYHGSVDKRLELEPFHKPDVMDCR